MIENCAHPMWRPALHEYVARAAKESPGKHTPHLIHEAFSFMQTWKAGHPEG